MMNSIIFMDHETQTAYEGICKHYPILIEMEQEPLRQYSCIRLEVMRTTWKDTKPKFFLTDIRDGLSKYTTHLYYCSVNLLDVFLLLVLSN
jgi:hypothetical protein